MRDRHTHGPTGENTVGKWEREAATDAVCAGSLSVCVEQRTGGGCSDGRGQCLPRLLPALLSKDRTLDR